MYKARFRFRSIPTADCWKSPSHLEMCELCRAMRLSDLQIKLAQVTLARRLGELVIVSGRQLVVTTVTACTVVSQILISALAHWLGSLSYLTGLPHWLSSLA